jgi:perosamine synthetase
MIELAAVELDAEAERLVLQVLRSGRLAQGPMVERFEHEFASIAGTRHAVAVSSGTAALVLALQGAGIGPGDEVVTSPFTFVATLNAIMQVGASARFADIRPDDFTIDPGAAGAAVSSRTAAILPVHLYGHPAAMTELAELAASHDLRMIEDAAQAHGAVADGQLVGSFGVGCFSFYASKNMTTGEGGMVTTDDPEVAARVRILRNQGMREAYLYEAIGYNLRMTEVSAAIGVSELRRLADRTARRKHNASRLSEGLSGMKGLVLPFAGVGREHVYHQYTVRVTAEAACSRDDLAAGLGARGIRTGIYYPRPVYDYECFRDHPLVCAEPMPCAEQAAAEVLSLPVHPGLTDEEIDMVAAAVGDVLDA